jgi:cell division transport system ATP-binding protein
MITGFNTNVRHGGRQYHVQTEDSGRSNPRVISHVYFGGTILASHKRDYTDLLQCDDLTGLVRRLMEEQHKSMLDRLKNGEFDQAIASTGPRLRRGHRLAEAARRGDPRVPGGEGAREGPEGRRAGGRNAIERVRRWPLRSRLRPWSAATAAAPGAGGDAAVRMFHVSKSYGAGSFALRDVSLELERGEFVFLTGPSGAGKTTLLKLLLGAESPSEGQIVVLGRNIARLGERAIPPLRRRIGVVFQDFKLLPRRSVEENVALALDVLGTPRRRARAQVFAILKQLGLQHRRYHHPLSLSGGEQQRVAIARALVNEPQILLADEPTGNLDPDLTVEIMDLIASAATRGTTVLVATHELGLVERYGKRTVRLEGGRLVEDTPARGSAA